MQSSTAAYGWTSFGLRTFGSTARTVLGTSTESEPIANSSVFIISPLLWQERVGTAALYGVIAAFGVVLNTAPILLTFCTNMRKNNVHVMIATLSTADLMFSVSFIFGQIQYVLYREQLSPIPCRWLGMVSFTTAFFEFMFPPVLSVNRYIALYHSNRYDRIFTRRNIAIIIIGSWTFCGVIPVVFAAFGKTKFDYDNEHCCIVVEGSEVYWTVIYWLLIIIPLVCFCDGTMLFCNVQIYRKLTDHSSVQTLKNNVIRQNRELLYFLIADMTFPIMFHTTYHVAKFAMPHRIDILSKRVFMTLYLINSCVRGLATLTMLRPYRLALRHALCACCTKTDHQDQPAGGNQVAPATGKTSLKECLYAERVHQYSKSSDSEEPQKS